MRADELLEMALQQGSIVRGTDVDRASFPDATRTYLSDGTGIAWVVPDTMRGTATFAIDAEIPGPVRPSLVRRYGMTDSELFARAWTRAEVWAKLFDVPIVTWLSRHGLDEPEMVAEATAQGLLATSTTAVDGHVRTQGVLIGSIERSQARHPGVVGGDV